ncbi:uncharacterized protein LOC103502255 [Cucumis melo]|uniref:Uncharacterized protein LOC103502255 n=1 Tax=Cucumis melo TaxID=3656 RepID=A0A1S3CMT1_CUCME|nr:uncharacterized protein LOC103502255 [Cucumis melo]
MKRGSKLLKNIEEIENSNENTKELNDVVVHDHCPFFLSIFNLVFQITMAFYRFLGFRVHRPILSSSEDSYPVDSQPPPTTVDPPIEDPGEEEREFARRNPPPPPPPSNGGGGRTN